MEKCEIISDELRGFIIAEPKTMSRKDFMADLKPRDELYLTKNVTLNCSKYPCQMKIRQNIDNPLNFSVILVYRSSIIVRYNGYHGSHTNRLEKTRVSGPHIHTITERYQLRTQRPDGYAEETDRYTDLNTAINEFIKDMNITIEGLENTRSIDDYA